MDNSPAKMDDINILIVDDEAAVRTVLTRYMTEAGYRSVAVESAEAARKELRASRFDLLLCDMNMPGETGQGLAIADDVIAGKHDGTLVFETEPGTGTTFIIRLPRRNV